MKFGKQTEFFSHASGGAHLLSFARSHLDVAAAHWVFMRPHSSSFHSLAANHFLIKSYPFIWAWVSHRKTFLMSDTYRPQREWKTDFRADTIQIHPLDTRCLPRAAAPQLAIHGPIMPGDGRREEIKWENANVSQWQKLFISALVAAHWFHDIADEQMAIKENANSRWIECLSVLPFRARSLHHLSTSSMRPDKAARGQIFFGNWMKWAT